MSPGRWIPPLLALAFSPLLFGVINRTKAFIAGRKGPPLLQTYFDVMKLLRKGAVYSRTTTWVFRLGPPAGLAALLAATALVPFGDWPAPAPFRGDLFLFAALLAAARFATVLAALDTGSSFEGMGASREVQFSALAEPALLLGLVALARQTGGFSLSNILGGVSTHLWVQSAPALTLVAAALGAVYLAENARLPVDDPNTHLELTMIHEVMALDHGGPDLAFILCGSALKLWLLGALIIGTVVPLHGGNAWKTAAAHAGGMILLAVATGLVESMMARLRLLRVPQLLVGAGVLSALALILGGRP